MSVKEAAARIKINKLLEAAGWRFFQDATGAANIQSKPRSRASGAKPSLLPMLRLLNLQRQRLRTRTRRIEALQWRKFK